VTAGMTPLAAGEQEGPVADLLKRLDVAHPHPFLATVSVQSGDLSRLIPHANNVQYVVWLDRIAELHAEAAGWPRHALLASQVMWFVRRHEVDYLGEAWEGDRLLGATWISNAGRTTCRRETRLARLSDGRPICQALSTWVLVNLVTRRPARAPREMLAQFDLWEMPAPRANPAD
jgi:acyl-CoA thioester hydrolase